MQARSGKSPAERIGIVSDHIATQQGGFDRSCPSSHEWVVDNVPWLREAIDEKPGKLWLEARPVGDLVKRGSLTLL